MTLSPSDSGIYGSSFGHPAISAAFGDRQAIARMLEVEVALARVQGQLGVIPKPAAERIVQVAATLEVDPEQLQPGTDRAGFPVAELVRRLRAQAGSDAGRYVHFGATTQDIVDTARVLQIREALRPIDQDLAVLIDKLAELADRHRDLVMPGRTHSQQAFPITFGYKVATWLAPLVRHRRRLSEIKPRLLWLQFGGAVGTLAAYGASGPDLYQAMAGELDLALPTTPWHTQRDGMAEFAGWLSLVSGALAKIAQDVLLLAQTEIGEVRESDDPTRGESSAMPQKRNPVASEHILAAARANAGLLSSMHQALVHEHERGTHGLQLEWLSLPQMMALTASALAKAVFISEHLVVDPQRMRENLEAAQGTLLAEAVRDALALTLGREAADGMVREACQVALSERRPLVSVLREKTDAPVDWNRFGDAGQHLGSAGWFIDRVLSEARG
jgi:3-carboxy-cis,cis-muconate cycloisomerase